MVEWIKEHPYLTGGLALVIVILIVVVKNASSSSASAATAAQTASGTDDTQAVAALQANAAIQSQAYAAQTQIAGYNATVNATALQTAAQTSIANNQTAGAVELGLAQSNNQVAIASIAAGGITPFSVNGPGSAPSVPTTGVVGNAQVQSAVAAQAVQQNASIENTSNAIAATPSVNSGGTALPNPANYNSYGQFLYAINPGGQCNDPENCDVGMSENDAAVAAQLWQATYSPTGSIVQAQAVSNANLNVGRGTPASNPYYYGVNVVNGQPVGVSAPGSTTLGNPISGSGGSSTMPITGSPATLAS